MSAIMARANIHLWIGLMRSSPLSCCNTAGSVSKAGMVVRLSKGAGPVLLLFIRRLFFFRGKPGLMPAARYSMMGSP